MQTPDTRTDRERELLAAMAEILLEVCENETKPHSSDSYLPEHLIANAMKALEPYGWPA